MCISLKMWERAPPLTHTPPIPGSTTIVLDVHSAHEPELADMANQMISCKAAQRRQKQYLQRLMKFKLRSLPLLFAYGCLYPERCLYPEWS